MIQARVGVGAANFFRQAAARPPEEATPATTRPTPSMLARAAASDMREAFPTYYDEEAAHVGAYHHAAPGSFESTLAEEDN